MENVKTIDDIPFDEGPLNTKIYTVGGWSPAENWVQIKAAGNKDGEIGVKFFGPVSMGLAKEIQGTLRPKALVFNPEDYENLDFLSVFADCQALSIGMLGELKGTLDLGALPNLSVFSGNIWKNLKNLSRTQLTDCTIGSNKTAKSVEEMGLPKTLRRLTIASCTLRTLTGIEHLMDLESLVLINCRGIDSLSLLERLPRLTDLRLEMMPKIGSGAFPVLPNLQKLHIVNQKLDSVAFLKNLPNLTDLNLGLTKVESGDFSEIDLQKKWSYLFFKPKKGKAVHIPV